MIHELLRSPSQTYLLDDAILPVFRATETTDAIVAVACDVECGDRRKSVAACTPRTSIVVYVVCNTKLG